MNRVTLTVYIHDQHHCVLEQPHKALLSKMIQSHFAKINYKCINAFISVA